MGWAERRTGRLFAVSFVIAVVASTSWFTIPVVGHVLGLGWDDRTGTAVEGADVDAQRIDEAGAGAPAVAAPDVDADTDDGEPATPARQDGFWDGTVFLPPAQGYVWPLIGAKITTWFAPASSGSMMLAGQAIHNGLDMARPCWTPIRAAHDGTVVYAGRRADPYLGFSGSVQPYYQELARRKLGDRALAIMVVIDDGNGLESVYVHLAREDVNAGDVVSAGETIGYVGATGNATGCHLHYSLIVARGPWVPVAPYLVEKWHYPSYMRLRVDPLLYLSLDSPEAAIPGARLAPRPEPLHYIGPLPSRSDASIEGQ